MDFSSRQEVIEGGLAGDAPSMAGQRFLVALEREPRQPGDRVGAERRRERLRSLRDALGDDAVDMLNLLKFKPDGESSYAAYGREFAKLVETFAPSTQVVYSADCAGLLMGTEEWDRLIIVRYPTLQAFLKLTSSPEYERIAHLRTDALERTVLYAMVPSSPEIGS